MTQRIEAKTLSLAGHKPSTAGHFGARLNIATAVALGFVLPLGEDDLTGPLEPLGTDNMKAALVLVAMLASTLIWMSQDSRTPLRNTLGAKVAFTLYASSVLISTLLWSLPMDRFALFGANLLAAIYLWVFSEAISRGSWLTICFSVGISHVIYTAIAGEAEQLYAGSEITRTTAAISANAVGFEAALVLGLSVWHITSSRRRALNLAIATVSTYVIYLTFSRSAILSIGLGALLAAAHFSTPRRVIATLAAASVSIFLYVRYSTSLVAALGGDRAYGFSTLTGRTTIWADLIQSNEHWMRGYGYGALRFADGAGPDAGLRAATKNYPRRIRSFRPH